MLDRDFSRNLHHSKFSTQQWHLKNEVPVTNFEILDNLKNDVEESNKSFQGMEYML